MTTPPDQTFIVVRTYFSKINCISGPATGLISYISNSYEKAHAFAKTNTWELDVGCVYLCTVKQDVEIGLGDWANGIIDIEIILNKERK